MEILKETLTHGLTITFFVFVMMMLIDYLTVLTKGRLSSMIKGGIFRQYFIASSLGAVPGCLGSFMNVSFYIRGLISFGAILGGMIATSGDEAFIMLALFPDKALLLFGILFLTGIISAYLIDKLIPVLKIKPCEDCRVSDLDKHDDECRCLNIKEVIEHIKKLSFIRFLLLISFGSILYGLAAGMIGPAEWEWERITFIILSALSIFIVITVPDHYLEEHIWDHIAKKHLWKIFLWSFGALLIVNIGLKFWNLEAFVHKNMLLIFLLAGLINIIPGSGPHLIFVMMFSRGIIPFSVLLTSSIVQDGHGLLPLLSYSVRDSLLIKLFKFLIGIGLGALFFLLGY